MKRFLTSILTCALLLNAAPLAVHAEEAVYPGDLIKASGPAVYYYYGNRYSFPSEAVYLSWYDDFSNIKTVSDEFLASVPLAGNVRFRPGRRMVKITTDPKVYLVSTEHTLRWIPTEEQAKSLYGDDWATDVRDVSDAFFADYQVGEPLTTEESTRIGKAIPGSYLEHIEAVADTTADIVDFTNPLRNNTDFSFSPINASGYHGTFTRSRAEAQATIEQLSSGWTKAYEFEMLIGNTSSIGMILNFTQPRGNKVAHRSVAIASEDASGNNTFEENGTTAIDILEVEVPSDALVYPQMVTAKYRTGGGVTYQEGIVSVLGDEVGTWLKENAAAKGWTLLREMQETKTNQVTEWVFQKTGSKELLVIRHTYEPIVAFFFGGISAVQSVRILPRS